MRRAGLLFLICTMLTGCASLGECAAARFYPSCDDPTRQGTFCRTGCEIVYRRP